MSASVVNTPSLFGDASIDHAVAGFGAGTVATLVMHPLDLVKIRFQLAETPRHPPSSYHAQPTAGPSRLPPPPTPRSSILAEASHSMARKRPGFGRAVYGALEDAVKADGWKGLYRGLVPNLVGGAGSWGLYFLFYNMIKKQMQMQHGDPAYRTTSAQHLQAAAEASAVTAMLTNPIWVVKTRIFATAKHDPKAYRGLWDGLRSIYRTEGLRGLYKGSLLALVGVSNGSIQFATYEEIKRRRTDIKRRLYDKHGRPWRVEDEKLVSCSLQPPLRVPALARQRFSNGGAHSRQTNTEYILASGSSKFVAIALTYPYQVVRARIQNAPATVRVQGAAPAPRLTIPMVVSSAWRNEGILAFYKGLGTNALRILPGTCTTFVVYENLVWAFRALAVRRERELK